MTAGENTTKRLEWDDTTKKFVSREYKTILNIAYWVAFNGSPDKLIVEPMLDRFMKNNIVNSVADDFRETRALESGDKSADVIKLQNRVFDRFRHNQALITLLGRASQTVFKESINLTVANNMFTNVENEMKESNQGLQPLRARLKARYQLLCKGLTLLNAVYMVFECPASSERGKPFTRYSLLKCKPFLVCSQEIAVFAWTLMKEQVQPQIVTEILKSMETHFAVPANYRAYADARRSGQEPPSNQTVAAATQRTGVTNKRKAEIERHLVLNRSVANARGNKRHKPLMDDSNISPENKEAADAMFQEDEAAALEADRENKYQEEEDENVNTTSSSSNTPKFTSWQAMQDLGTPGADYAIDFKDDPLMYTERYYGEDKLYAQHHLRRYGLAVSLRNNDLQKLGIDTDDIQAVIESLEKRKYVDPRTKVEKPGLVFRTSSITMCRKAFDGLHEQDTLLTYIGNAYDPQQAIPGYKSLLGYMDPKRTGLLLLHDFGGGGGQGRSSGSAAAAAATRKRQQKNKTIKANARYACPGSIAVLAALVGERVDDAHSIVKKVYDKDPVTLVDDNLFENTVLKMRMSYGMTDEVIERTGMLHPSSCIYTRQVMDYLERHNKKPVARYPDQFIDVNTTVTAMKEIIDQDDRTMARSRVKALPRMSTSLDRCISEITRDGSEIADPRAELMRTISLKTQSDSMRRRLTNGLTLTTTVTTTTTMIEGLGLRIDPSLPPFHPLITTTSSSSSDSASSAEPSVPRRSNGRPPPHTRIPRRNGGDGRGRSSTNSSIMALSPPSHALSAHT
jgi:hypothetical protein